MGKQAECTIAQALSSAKNEALSSDTSWAMLCGFHTGWSTPASWSLQCILEPAPKTPLSAVIVTKLWAAVVQRIKAEGTGDLGQQRSLRTREHTLSKKATESNL